MAYISFQPQDYFNTTLWTGDGNSTQNITGTGFNADWIWLKGRSGAGDHQLYDKVRGVQKMIISNGANAESTNSIGLQTFGSDGFTMGSDMTGSGSTFASWNWKANGAGSSNTDGSITTTVSANTTAGFSIVKWTAGSGVSGIGHGLGVIPKLIICKDLSVSSAWTVGSDLLNNWGGYLGLQSTNALNSETRMYKPSGYSSPTASLFYQNHSAFGSAGENMIAYCFAEKQGFSKFGEYTGNENANGPFIYTGFKPAFVMIKNRGSAGKDWFIHDNKRLGYNEKNYGLFPNLNNAEATDINLDLLSNGFKLRRSTAQLNHNGNFYIYMAFAESTIVSSNGVPAVAR